jgi:hypothetical protein
MERVETDLEDINISDPTRQQQYQEQYFIAEKDIA